MTPLKMPVNWDRDYVTALYEIVPASSTENLSGVDTLKISEDNTGCCGKQNTNTKNALQGARFRSVEDGFVYIGRRTNESGISTWKREVRRSRCRIWYAFEAIRNLGEQAATLL